MSQEPVWVLVHSPLVGPGTWSRVAEELRRRGDEVIVPVVSSSGGVEAPFWQKHVYGAIQALDSVPVERPLILVGHSGAGPLLPAIRRAVPHPAAAYVFVDASIPRDGASYLDLVAAESPEMAQEFRALLASGGLYPTWTDDDLRELIPDDALRRQVLAELHPQPLGYFDEPLPVFTGWPDAPCLYLRWSPPYLVAAAQARQAGWPVREMEAGHFHMLVEPGEVAELLLELVRGIEDNSSEPAMGQERMVAQNQSNHSSVQVRLREVSKDDFPIFFEQQLDPEADHMAAFTAKDPGDRDAFLAHWTKLMSSDTGIARTILYGDQVAGHITHFDQFGKPSVGYWIGRSFWDQGVATRALAEFLQLVTVRPLYARAVKDNLASIRVLQKCGFIIVGEDVGFANARGQVVGEYILELLEQ